MSGLKYWIWLQLGLGADADIKSVIRDFGSPKGVYDASVLEWTVCEGITSARLDRLTKATLYDAEKIIVECEANGWSIISYDDERYPETLREIDRPPAVLYAEGDIGCLKDRLAIAIVGTRKASEYSLRAAQYLAKGIAKCGAVIVSGGALGVDSSAHKGALEGDGLTVAVLGCGLGTDYLRANESLRRSIVENGGVLITEFPPHTRADKTTFPVRNRIISGLSAGVIVVEAAEKSGSLITAEKAYQQGRDIFAVPASIFDKAFQGTNKLIEEGAFVATSPLAVLRRYADDYYTLDLSKAESMYELSKVKLGANAPTKKQLTFDTISESRAAYNERHEKALQLSGNEKAVYEAIGDSLTTPEEIGFKTKLSSVNVMTALTVLEIKGLIRKAEGDRYARA